MPNGNPFAQELATRDQNPFSAEIDRRQPELRAPVEIEQKFAVSPVTGIKYPRRPTRAERAEATGIKGGDLGLKVRAAVATGTADDVRNQIALQFDIPVNKVELANIPELGYVYKIPGMKELQLVDPVGFDVGDIAKGLEILPAAAGALAGIPAAFGTKSPVAGAGVAGTAAAGTKAAQLGILKNMGIIDPTFEEILKESATEGALEFIGGVAPSIVKGIWRALPTESAARLTAIERLSEKINPDDLAAGRLKTDQVADIVEKETGVRPEFTTAQQLATVEPERAAVIEGVQDITEAGVEARRSQRIAGEALEERIAPVEDEFIRERAAAGVREVAEQRVQQAEQSIRNIQERTITRLENLKTNLPQMEAGEAGFAIRNALEEGKEQAYAPLKTAYNEFDAEFADIPIDIKIMKDAAKELDKQPIIFPDWAPDRKSVISQAQRAEGQVGFSDVQSALSDIRTRIRTMREAGATPSELKSLDKIKGSLQGARDEALRNASPDKANRILELEEQYAKYKEATGQGLVRTILKKGADGRYTVPDRTVMNNVIKSADDIRLYKQTAEEFPELNVIPQMREALLVKYRNQVIDGGGNHKRFMQENGDAARELLTKKEFAQMSSAGRAKSAIPLAINREKELLRGIRKEMPEYELAGFNSSEVMNKMKGNVQLSNKIKTVLKRYPDKWKMVQEARKADITKQAQTLSGLDTMLDKQKPELIATLGRDYVKTLEVAADLARTSGRNLAGTPIREVEEKGSLDLARALVFGPLSHWGFIRNMASGVSRDKAKRLNRELLQDSKLLEQVIRAHKAKDQARALRAVAVATGVGLWASDNELDVLVIEER